MLIIVTSEMITLYVEGYFTNVWDASCMIALGEKQLEFTTARALLRDGQGVPPALRDDAGIGRIPALQHGDVWLTESIAIVEYLEDVFPPPAHARLLPVAPRARARARQVMAWLRSDLWALRQERPWQLSVYPSTPLAPMSPDATKQARELVALADWLDARGELADWNIAHADLALALMRLARGGYDVTPAATQLTRAPKPAPINTRPRTPAPGAIAGSVACGWCAKLGASSSCASGSASQICRPCIGPPDARNAGSARSECAMPRPAVIKFTSPGRLTCTLPRLSRWTFSPARK